MRVKLRTSREREVNDGPHSSSLLILCSLPEACGSHGRNPSHSPKRRGVCRVS